MTLKELRQSSEKQEFRCCSIAAKGPAVLLDFDGIDVELLADLGLFSLAAAVRAFKREQLFFEQPAAAAAPQLWFNFDKFKGGALAKGAFSYYAEVSLNGFSDIA